MKIFMVFQGGGGDLGEQRSICRGHTLGNITKQLNKT